MIQIKRVYEPVEPGDGWRVLVERLWPRGVSKEKAHLDEWLKEIAPSTDLRKWYHHELDKWPLFQQRYRKELQENTELVQSLRQRAQQGMLTLIYAAKDEQHNSALVLKEYLEAS